MTSRQFSPHNFLRHAPNTMLQRYCDEKEIKIDVNWDELQEIDAAKRCYSMNNSYYKARSIFIDSVIQWWQGEYVPPPSPEETYPFLIFCSGHYNRPWLAVAIEALFKIFKTHWQFWIATAIGVVGIILTM